MSQRKLSQNWIMSYAQGYAPHTEAPTQFMIWSAISAVGAALKNRIWFKHGTFTIFPNQYIILTSEPGIGKGSSIHPVYNIVKELGLSNIMSDRITAPRIIERLSTGQPGQLQNIGGHIGFKKDSTATIISTELQTLLTSSDWMLSFLCDMWDRGEFYYDTKTQGSSNVVSGLCVSLIGACVPNYIRKINKDIMATINGGFTARALFIFADDVSQRIPLPIDIESTQKGKKLIQDLKDDLTQISTLSGQVKFDWEAERYYIKIYNGMQIKDTDSDVVRHFKRRMHVHIIKLAMIFSASHRDDLTINKIDLLNAEACVNDVMKNLDRTFRGVGDSDLAEATSKVQDFIEKKGSCTYNEILMNLHRHVSPENLARIMGVMYQIGFCIEANVGKQKMIKLVKARHTAQTTLNSLVP